MKILCVCDRFPFPPQRGGKIRPFNMIRHLSASHEVNVGSLARSRDEAREEGIAEFCSRYVMAEVRNPVQVARAWCHACRRPRLLPSSFFTRLYRQVRERLARKCYDLIFVHCSSMAQCVEALRGTTKILDFGGMDCKKRGSTRGTSRAFRSAPERKDPGGRGRPAGVSDEGRRNATRAAALSPSAASGTWARPGHPSGW